MKCREWKKKIPYYLAGEMPGNECAAFENHVSDCNYCREELDSFREIDMLINAARLDIPDIDFTSSIMNKIEPSRNKIQLSEDKIQLSEDKIQLSEDKIRLSRNKGQPSPKNIKPVKGKGKRTVAVLQDLVTAAAAAMILFWFSGPALSAGEFPVQSDHVVRVSDTVGGAFQSYVDFSASTANKLSASIKQMDPIQMKGDE